MSLIEGHKLFRKHRIGGELNRLRFPGNALTLLKTSLVQQQHDGPLAGCIADGFGGLSHLMIGIAQRHVEERIFLRRLFIVEDVILKKSITFFGSDCSPLMPSVISCSLIFIASELPLLTASSMVLR